MQVSAGDGGCLPSVSHTLARCGRHLRSGLWPVQHVRPALPSPWLLGQAGGLRPGLVWPLQVWSHMFVGGSASCCGVQVPSGDACLVLGICWACIPGQHLAESHLGRAALGPGGAEAAFGCPEVPLALSPFRGDLVRPWLAAPGPLGWSRAEAMPVPAWCCLGSWPLGGGG